MLYRVSSLVLALFVAGFVSSPALAQGTTTSSISGVVVDADGGAVPGATVTVRDVATGATYSTVTTGTGSFTVPAVNIGTYTVTVSLQGFKTVVLNNVAVTAGGPATVRATLEVGGVSETVVVEGAGAVLQTQATAISQTISVDEISNLPLISRSTLDFVTLLPGVNTPGSNRSSTINGLAQGSINITLDGVNIQDNTLKTTDGFFAIVSPRLDAIEEVSVTSAAQGAESAGQGATQIKFVTRGGSNTFSGSGYHYFRSDALNANTWFNIRDGVAKEELLQNQPGVRLGGPVVIPGLYDGHNKAFFFVNYEEFRQPSTQTETRTLLSPEAQRGLFRYTTSAGVREVDVLALAAANGRPSAVNPLIGQLLADIRNSTAITGSVTDSDDPNVQRLTWNVDSSNTSRFPTVRLDLNVTENHRISGAANVQFFNSVPDLTNNREPAFPGFPVTSSQRSTRINVSTALRSNFGNSMVNELRIGSSGAPVDFSPELTTSMYSGPLANQAGFDLNISTARISDAGFAPAPSSRNAYTWLVENTLNWQKGEHGLNLGASFNQVDVWIKNQNMLPTIDFDVLNGDPAKPLFASSANFPGSSGTNRGDAEDLYAVLVGSVSAITATARINPATNRFVYLGESLQEGQLRDFAFWAQDAWRPRPDLTINLGLRYELQMPFTAKNASYSTATLEDIWGISGLSATCTNASAVTPETCNIFKPGTEPGKAVSEYIQLDANARAYNIDWDNVAPSVGLAWTPSAEGSGWIARFLGQPGDTVLRAGYSRSFNRPGMSDFTGRFDDNPGLTLTANRNESLGNLGALPLFLSETDRLGAPAFNEDRIYPLTEVVTEDITRFDPNLQVPYNDTWTAGWQRAVSRNMAFEARYVGTRSRDLWTTYNLNEVNVLENGIFDEFLLAQANLQANIAAGRGATFKYFGEGTGTSPLPIALAYFSGLPSSLAGEPARYTSGDFASSTFVDELAMFNPNVFDFANALDSTQGRRDNALRAGLPSNFLIVNPNKIGGAEIGGFGGYTNYHSMQLELRRRMAQGLQFQASYVFGRAYTSQFYSFRVPRLEVLDGGGEGGVAQAVKASWVYELPFGQGKRFAGNTGAALDRIVGGWQVHGTARIQTGQIVDFGNVRMVGFDKTDLQGFYQFRTADDGKIYMLPQDVIDNTIKAFSVDATSPTGYSALGAPEGRYFAPASGPDCIETVANNHGDCGERTISVNAPLYKNVDLSIVKLVPITGRVRAEFRVELLNAFNWVNYTPVAGIGAVVTGYEVTGLNGTPDARIMQLVSRITW
jgi:hypothetical protein